MTDNTLELARAGAVRRVATRAGSLKFNKQIGQVIGADAAKDNTIDRSATLTKLLSIYNRMRAAKMYGLEDQFQQAEADMRDAIHNYSLQSPAGADRIRNIVQKLSFDDASSKARAKATSAAANKP